MMKIKFTNSLRLRDIRKEFKFANIENEQVGNEVIYHCPHISIHVNAESYENITDIRMKITEKGFTIILLKDDEVINEYQLYDVYKFKLNI